MELSLQNITKKYSDKVAVNDVSLSIEKGITGLLGANGAGKTTLMRMVADIIKPDAGSITYDGVPKFTKILKAKFYYKNKFNGKVITEMDSAEFDNGRWELPNEDYNPQFYTLTKVEVEYVASK